MRRHAGPLHLRVFPDHSELGDYVPSAYAYKNSCGLKQTSICAEAKPYPALTNLPSMSVQRAARFHWVEVGMRGVDEVFAGFGNDRGRNAFSTALMPD